MSLNGRSNIDYVVKKSDIDLRLSGSPMADSRRLYLWWEYDKCRTCGVPQYLCVQYSFIDNYRIKEAQLPSANAGLQVSYPVVYDLEYAKASKLSAKISEMALTFCNEVHAGPDIIQWFAIPTGMIIIIDWFLLSSGCMDRKIWDTIQAPDKERYNYTIYGSHRQ